jgi:hypothetical protein
LFLYSYEADFIQGFIKKNERKILRFINFTVRYKDDVLSLKESADCGDLIFLIELEIKDTTDIIRAALYLDLVEQELLTLPEHLSSPNLTNKNPWSSIFIASVNHLSRKFLCVDVITY